MVKASDPGSQSRPEWCVAEARSLALAMNRNKAFSSAGFATGRSLLALSLSLTALASTGCRATEGQVGPEPAGGRVEEAPAAKDPLAAIEQLEASRSDGGGELERLSREGSERVRARAALALGRLPFPEFGAAVSDALHAALADPSAEVRAAAAFGIGLRADPSSTQPLKGAWNDPESIVRARVVEAASRLPGTELRAEILYQLFSDPSFRVRAEAAVAPHRWSTESEGAAEQDDALARAALAGFQSPPSKDAKAPVEAGAGAAGPEAAKTQPAEVVWRALFSLQRRAWERARAGRRDEIPALVREALLHWARPEAGGESRLFAVMGLGALTPDEQVREALYAGLDAQNWRIACEAARGLGQAPHTEAIGPLQKALGHPSEHVRQAAAESLGSFGGDLRAPVQPLLSLALADTSPNVRGAAIGSLARLDGDRAAAQLGERALERDPRIRAAVARALQPVSDAVAVPILLRLTRDPDHAVSYTATEALGHHLTPEARARLRELLTDRDNGLRLGAIEALAGDPSAEDLEGLQAAWVTSTGDIAPEIRARALEVAGEIGGEAAIALLQRGLATGGMYERRIARAALSKLAPDEELPPLAPPPRLSVTPLPPYSADRPVVEVVTSRGSLVFELLADEAPRHVHNFLELAKADRYDGLTFHRVVGDYVVQGGDYRGDGNGGTTWDGSPLPAEFGPRKFERGALGMPRNDDPESGGSQFFITHRPTPHLDGRYTLFGELRNGWEVLDALEVGDRILDVRLRGSARP